jgi:hypothetical protein
MAVGIYNHCICSHCSLQSLNIPEYKYGVSPKACSSVRSSDVGHGDIHREHHACAGQRYESGEHGV